VTGDNPGVRANQGSGLVADATYFDFLQPFAPLFQLFYGVFVLLLLLALMQHARRTRRAAEGGLCAPLETGLAAASPSEGGAEVAREKHGDAQAGAEENPQAPALTQHGLAPSLLGTCVKGLLRLFLGLGHLVLVLFLFMNTSESVDDWLWLANGWLDLRLCTEGTVGTSAFCAAAQDVTKDTWDPIVGTFLLLWAPFLLFTLVYYFLQNSVDRFCLAPAPLGACSFVAVLRAGEKEEAAGGPDGGGAQPGEASLLSLV
jgi:hypothetical protein